MTPHAQAPVRPVALVTGASRGLGRALARELAAQGWALVLDARDPVRLHRVAVELGALTDVSALAGDVADPAHREALGRAVDAHRRLDALVNNASVLGPSPLVPLRELDLTELQRTWTVNALAPLALVQRVLPALERTGGAVVDVSSDAAVEAYAGWGCYGSAKAALDALTAVLAVEQPELTVYAFDPGDMATDLHQQAFPGEDVYDRPAPESVVPALLELVCGRLPSGRYRAADLAPVEAEAVTA
ncbi:short-subunit dehydrogenase [Motilibacter peucedani]|uniref:Short-subunit dehydrogenase n=1 Tax=Motilibacter peucedani TaxID=598650 RepID=A0A420XUQ9_9ACTN|nr:SDR family NAD(P)-dependent oxidoreductase [Motilibacter peucedani]RKS80389.1 short-subunit dehydrogenase [Motilibacter peucedani]